MEEFHKVAARRFHKVAARRFHFLARSACLTSPLSHTHVSQLFITHHIISSRSSRLASCHSFISLLTHLSTLALAALSIFSPLVASAHLVDKCNKT